MMANRKGNIVAMRKARELTEKLFVVENQLHSTEEYFIDLQNQVVLSHIN
jgi:hypothetical protein